MNPRPLLLGYVRVSTEDQASTGTSFESQRQQLLAYAKGLGADIEVFGDAAVSGATAHRSGLESVRARLRQGGVQAVVVTRLDRLVRDELVYFAFLQVCREAGVPLMSIAEGVDTSTEAGDMAGGIAVLFAAAERRRIAARTKEGREARAREGGFVGGTAPFGYRREPRLTDTGAQRGWRLVVHDEQARTIRTMYELLVVRGLAFADVARRLNTAGLTTASGDEWTSSSVSRWARRPESLRTASGAWRFSDIEVPVPAILRPAEADRWQRWQSNQGPRPFTQRGPYLLSGGVLSFPCGRDAMGRTTATDPAKYVCTGRYNQKGRGDDLDHSNCHPVEVRPVDASVIQALRVVLTNPDVIAAAANERAGTRATLNELEDELAAFDRMVSVQLREMRRAGLDRAALRALADDTAEERRRLTDAVRAEARRASVTTDPAAIRALRDSLREGLLSNDPGLWGRVLTALNVRVTVTGYRPCGTCGGSGRLPFPAKSGRRPPPLCPDCPRGGRWAEIRIELDEVAARALGSTGARGPR